MEVTSSVANKLVKKLNEDLKRLYQEEGVRATYIEVEGINPIIPKYSFADTHDEIADLMDKIVNIKHAINVFNSTTILEKAGLTIDEALVYMAMLNNERESLKNMIVPVEKRLNTGYNARNNQVEYIAVNYNIEEVRAKYDEVCTKITDLQVELDIVNTTVKFVITI